MRRAMSPATCTQVTSLPSGVRSRSALRSFSSDALSRAALTKAPGKYQRSFTTQSTGERFECRMNSASSQKGTDHHHPAKRPTRTETATAAPRKGQPSRAMIGCGYGGLTRYFCTLPPQAASSNATTSSASILRRVDKAVPLDPGHHFAQPRADLLDRQLGGHAPAAEEHRRSRAVFQHELLGVLARLDAR